MDLGDSLLIATALYTRMESRSRSKIRERYNNFFREYRELNHMEFVPAGRVPLFKPVYIPHHAVIRDASSTTKLRVVFNASCKTLDSTSLNDHLLIGPKLQQNISLEVHGFADASNRAYAAVVYLRVMHYSRNFHLVCYW